MHSLNMFFKKITYSKNIIIWIKNIILWTKNISYQPSQYWFLTVLTIFPFKAFLVKTVSKWKSLIQCL